MQSQDNHEGFRALPLNPMECGFIGIGTSAPNTRLHIQTTNGGVNSNLLTLFNNSTSTNTAATLIFGLSTSASSVNAGVRAVRSNSPGSTATYLAFLTTQDGTNLTEAFRADENFRLHSLNGRIKKTRIHTSAGNVTVNASTDHIVIVNKSSGAATQVDLPSSPPTGLEIVIKDGKGDAASNNITIVPAAGNIDGAANLVINSNYGKVALVYNGTQWNQI